MNLFEQALQIVRERQFRLTRADACRQDALRAAGPGRAVLFLLARDHYAAAGLPGVALWCDRQAAAESRK
jgi:hypothetical protein